MRRPICDPGAHGGLFSEVHGDEKQVEWHLRCEHRKPQPPKGDAEVRGDLDGSTIAVIQKRFQELVQKARRMCDLVETRALQTEYYLTAISS